MGWFDDIAWAARMLKARRLRREAGFAQRVRFDAALRPRLSNGRDVIAYPDAAYHSSRRDFDRACKTLEVPDAVSDV